MWESGVWGQELERHFSLTKVVNKAMVLLVFITIFSMYWYVISWTY